MASKLELAAFGHHTVDYCRRMACRGMHEHRESVLVAMAVVFAGVLIIGLTVLGIA